MLCLETHKSPIETKVTRDAHGHVLSIAVIGGGNQFSRGSQKTADVSPSLFLDTFNFCHQIALKRRMQLAHI